MDQQDKKQDQKQGQKPDNAIHYNEDVERHAQSGKPQQAAEKAKQALNDDKEAGELRQAEEKGKSRSAERR
jgi:hypothetical protein